MEILITFSPEIDSVTKIDFSLNEVYFVYCNRLSPIRDKILITC